MRKHVEIFRRVLLGTCLAALAMATGAGCAGLSAGMASGPRYRTVSVPPGRDPEAARRANEAGLNHLARGELDPAVDDFRRALTADVSFGPAHNNLGRAYYKQGDWYQAAWEFEYAAKLLPRHAQPRNNLGLVLEEAGELDRAVACYRDAIALDGENIEYRANLTRALIRRGDRTDEVRTLLGQLVERDPRPEWHRWAQQQASRLGSAATE